MNAISIAESISESSEVSLFRLYLLRALYLVWAVGLAFKVFPRFFPAELSAPVMNTVVNSVLVGLSLTAFLGVRYPLKMLPLMFFEIAWKVVWLLSIGLPLWRASALDAQSTEVFKAIATVIVFPFVIPWRYVFERFIKAPGDRWR